MPKILPIHPERRPNGRHDHEWAFVSRYRLLLRAARRLTEGDPEAADDLLHDAFVQFVGARPDLGGIGHLDGYLTTLLRNLRVSRLRRRANQARAQVAVEEYDSVDRALEQVDPHQALAARDALMRVCTFACRRKATSRGASILILRFFHGFYPTEVERIANGPARTIRRLLADARVEARASLTASPRPREAGRNDDVLVPSWPALTSLDPAAMVRALREAIFQTRTPPCPAPSSIASWYRRPGTMLETGDLAHVASCRRCLTRICTTLGVPPPDEGSPFEPPDDNGSSESATRMVSAPRPIRKAKRRGLRDLLEHQPRELQIAVNGLPAGSLRVTAADNQVRWALRIEEPLAFIEVHSEQGQRMLLLNVASPTDGGVVQRASVRLTHDRLIEATLDFAGLHPTLTVQYIDPSVAEEAVPTPAPGQPPLAEPTASTADGIAWRASWRARLRHWWRRPVALVPAVVAVVVVALSAWWLSQPDAERSPDAIDVVAMAVDAETSAAPGADEATRQTLRFQVRRTDTGSVDADHQIDRWVFGDSARRATRVLDASGRVVAGQWTDASARVTTVGLGAWDEAWQDGLSPRRFRDRYASRACATTADADSLTITCPAQPGVTGLLDVLTAVLHAQSRPLDPTRSTLVVRRRDSRAVRLVLHLNDGGVERIASLEERGFERVPLSSVPSDVLTPIAAPDAAATAPPAVALRRVTPSLEVQVVDLVDRLPDNEYLSVLRRDERLVVTGLVPGAEQRRVVMRALQRLGPSAPVGTEVFTFAEAARRQSSPPTQGSTRVEVWEATPGRAPIHAFLQRNVPADVDVAALVHDLAPRVLTHARRARREAVALGALIDRFPENVIVSLDADGQSAWQALARRRLGAAVEAFDALETALAPYLDSATGAGIITLTDRDSFESEVRRLSHETLTIAELLTAAFSATGAPDTPVESLPGLDVLQHVQRARSTARALLDRVQP